MYKTQTADALGGQAYTHTKSPLVLVNGEYLGGYSELEAFVGNSFAGVSAPPGEDSYYKELGQEKYLRMLTESSESGKSYAYIYIKIGDNKAKKVIFELCTKVGSTAAATNIRDTATIDTATIDTHRALPTHPLSGVPKDVRELCGAV